MKYFHPIENTCIDIMHSTYHGVIKELCLYWFELEGEFSLKSRFNEIDKRLIQIKPPNFIQTAPRSVSDYNIWRAHEYMNFILYYAFIVFYEIMNMKYYNHLKCLIISLEILSMKCIKRNDLDKVEKLLIKFLEDAPKLYSENILKSGFHELVHFADLTRQFGPLNLTSMFQYEEINRKITSFINSYDLIGEEFIKIFSLAQNLNNLSIIFKNDDKYKQYIYKYCLIKTSNRKLPSFSGVRFSQEPVEIENNNELDEEENSLIIN